MAKSSAPPQGSFDDRQLAAILFTDVASFSRLTEENETRTLMLVQRDLKLIASVCKEFGGEVLKNTGDGCLATFRSVEAAVRSALRIQGIIADAAHRLPPEQILHHRIGIHLGDVFFGQGDVLGNGVNIAARLLGEAEPDGICISQPVYDLVKNRLGVKAVFIGARELKNIRESVPVYRLLLGAAAEEQSGQPAAKPSSKASRQKMLVAAAVVLIAAIVCAGAWMVFRNKSTPAVATPIPVDSASQPPQATKTPVPQTIQQILQTPPTFIADSALAWQRFPHFANANITCGVDNGVYALTIVPDEFRLGLTICPWGSFDDATIEATGRIIGGGNASWAISLIAADGPRKVVRVTINERGVARIDLARLDGLDDTGRVGRPGDIRPYADPAIHRGDSFNVMVLNIHNHKLAISINGFVLGDPIDISTLGRTTLHTTVEGAKGARAEFQKLRLWLPTTPSTGP